MDVKSANKGFNALEFFGGGDLEKKQVEAGLKFQPLSKLQLTTRAALDTDLRVQGDVGMRFEHKMKANDTTTVNLGTAPTVSYKKKDKGHELTFSQKAHAETTTDVTKHVKWTNKATLGLTEKATFAAKQSTNVAATAQGSTALKAGATLYDGSTVKVRLEGGVGVEAKVPLNGAARENPASALVQADASLAIDLGKHVTIKAGGGARWAARTKDKE